MSALPWTKWFCSEWLSDPHLSRCCPATRGIWKDALDNMILACSPSICGPASVLSRLCRCSESEIVAAAKELKDTNTAEVDEQNGNITITCRRLVRVYKIKELRSIAGHISATKRQHHPQHDVSTNDPTRSASASASASSEENTGLKKPCPEDVSAYAESIGFKLNGSEFCDYYQSVGWTVGKKPMKDWKACVRTWKVKHQSERASKHRVGSNI